MMTIVSTSVATGTYGIFPAPGKPVFPLNLEEKDRDKKKGWGWVRFLSGPLHISNPGVM